MLAIRRLSIPLPHSTGVLAVTALAMCLGLVRFAAGADDAPQDAPKVWQGTWSNRKHKTTGPLKCTATRTGEGRAEALFEGTFTGDPFKYTVDVSTTSGRDRTVVQGTAQLDGDRYEWSGYVRGTVFYGQYRSLKGNNGEFRLEEVKK